MLEEVARRRAGQQAPAQGGQVHSGLGADGEDLGRGHQVREPQQVEHELDRVTGAVAAHVQDPLRVPHGRQQRADPVEMSSSPPTKICSVPVLAPAAMPLTGASRTGPTSPRAGIRPGPGRRRPARCGHVDPDRARRQPGQQAVRAEQHLLHVCRRGQHGDHHLAAAPARAGSRPSRARDLQVGGRLPADVVHEQVVPGRERWRLMGPPMWPSPMKPTFMLRSSCRRVRCGPGWVRRGPFGQFWLLAVRQTVACMLSAAGAARSPRVISSTSGSRSAGSVPSAG